MSEKIKLSNIFLLFFLLIMLTYLAQPELVNAEKINIEKYGNSYTFILVTNRSIVGFKCIVNISETCEITKVNSKNFTIVWDLITPSSIGIVGACAKPKTGEIPLFTIYINNNSTYCYPTSIKIKTYTVDANQNEEIYYDNSTKKIVVKEKQQTKTVQPNNTHYEKALTPIKSTPKKITNTTTTTTIHPSNKLFKQQNKTVVVPTVTTTKDNHSLSIPTIASTTQIHFNPNTTDNAINMIYNNLKRLPGFDVYDVVILILFTVIVTFLRLWKT